jgi:integrase
MVNGINSYTNQQVTELHLSVQAQTFDDSHRPPDGRNARLDLKARVGRHHFALLRGYLEGIDLRILARRYLHTEDAEAADLRIIKRILRWTIDELIVLARRQGKFAFAHAIDIDPGRIQTSASLETPSLDDFRAERDPDGFYSEAELLELFRDEYRQTGSGSHRKEKRNVRLRERQNDALRWLETQVAADPQLDDHLAGWFPETLAARLNAAGITTIRELVTWINQRGLRWYVPISKIGKEAAQRIHTWLEMNQGSLGHRFGKQVFTKRSELVPEDIPQREASEGIVPLEYFKARVELDGSTGSNRTFDTRSAASNDIEAIKLWLNSCSQIGGPTWLSYRREAERFLLWCVIEVGKPLSSVDAEDCTLYPQFLYDMGRLTVEHWQEKYRTNASDWLGQRGAPRSSTAWRPFDGSKCSAGAYKNASPATKPRSASIQDHSTGALGLTSQRQAIIILKTLFSWLTNIRYLERNPFEQVKPILEQRPVVNTERRFNFSEWKIILQTLETLPHDARYFRLRFILIFAYGTGLRLSELVDAKFDHLQASPSDPNRGNSPGYLLKVIGKRGKERAIPISQLLVDELQDYMMHRGFSSLDLVPADTYLIGRLQTMTSSIATALSRRRIDLSVDKLSARNLYQTLKEFFVHVHTVLQVSAPESAANILKASTHWLRHTADSDAIKSSAE